MTGKDFIPLDFKELSKQEMLERSQNFYHLLDARRSIREFSDKAINEDILHNIILSASTAPSGAHKQPWTFCLVKSSEYKQKIREAAEKEEYENYHGRMSDEWLEDLEKFGTDHIKPFLETAPYLIVVFKKAYDFDNGVKSNNYYVNESVGIAVGMLIAAIHNAGLCALTHTPSPMNFLAELLERPKNERAFLLIPVGYPADNCEVPNIKRKPLAEICKVY